jgi:tetratricopeptide (TPR) repeat protein
VTEYNEDFYQHQMQGSLRSAEIIIPMVLRLTHAQSVVDVGCGTGTWLSVYLKHDITDVLGLDGDYVDRRLLLIDEDLFLPHDLSTPVAIGRKFDLVQSLEVAEHIEQSGAEQFINGLVGLGDLILFSAAVPYQLGTGHVNERYIDYWIELFRQHDYLPIDAIRPGIWDNENVEVCYRQNTLMFAEAGSIAGNSELEAARKATNTHQLSIIHPDLYQPRINRLLATLTDLATTVQSNGNIPLARSITGSILDFDPRNSNAWNICGQLAAQANDFRSAASCLKRAIELDPSNASYIYNLGQVYAAYGHPEMARDQYTRALELRPADKSIRAALEHLGHS